MAIEAGQSLLHYLIVDKLGEGGMGEVWKATDTTLDRKVAITVVWDLAKSESRLLPDVPGPGEMSFRDGGKTHYVNRFPVESHIWMLTLRGPDSPG